MSPSPGISAGRPFAVPDYRRLWAIGACVGIARWVEFLALGVFAWQVTGSAELVALLAIIRMLPYVLFGFVVGALADHMDRRRLLRGIFLAAGASALVMAAIAVLGRAGYSTVVAAALVSGVIWITDMPIRRRLLVEAAGPEHMAKALGFDNSTTYATRGLGPLVGGTAYQWLGIEGIFLLTALAYFLCALLAHRLHPAAASREESDTRRFSVLSIIRPPRDLITSRPFLIVACLTVVWNVWCFPFVAMVPVIAQKDFDLSPAAVGALSASEGIGGTVGAIVIGMLASQRALFRIYYYGILAFFVLMLALSVHLTVAAAVIILPLIGVAAACFSLTQYALVYGMARSDSRSRATGFFSLFIGMNVFGFYNAGWLFARFSSVDALRIMALEGLVPLLVLGVLWLRTPRPPG